VQLVEKLLPEHWKACGAVMFPVRCDTAWGQETKPQVTAYLAIPPGQAKQVGKVVFQLLDTEGQTLAEHEAKLEVLQEEGGFLRAMAQWPTDSAAPGTYLLVGVVHDQDGKVRARVAPRMVSVHNTQGY
jgi:hypothetical protein